MTWREGIPRGWDSQLARRREGGLWRHLLGHKTPTRDAGRKEAPRRRSSGRTGSHLASRATQARGRPRTLAPARLPEYTHPGRRARADTRARMLAETCGHVHTQVHARREKSSETSRAGTEGRCYAQTGLSPLRTFTRTYTCPTQKNPFKGRGDRQLPQKQAELEQPVPHPSRKDARRLAALVEVGEGPQTSESRPGSLNRPGSTLEGPQHRLGCWKEGGGAAAELRKDPPPSRQRRCSHWLKSSPHRTSPRPRPH